MIWASLLSGYYCIPPNHSHSTIRGGVSIHWLTCSCALTLCLTTATWLNVSMTSSASGKESPFDLLCFFLPTIALLLASFSSTSAAQEINSTCYVCRVKGQYILISAVGSKSTISSFSSGMIDSKSPKEQIMKLMIQSTHRG